MLPSWYVTSFKQQAIALLKLGFVFWNHLVLDNKCFFRQPMRIGFLLVVWWGPYLLEEVMATSDPTLMFVTSNKWLLPSNKWLPHA